MGQGHHTQANQSVQCSRDSRGLQSGNVPGSFIFTDLSGKSQRKSIRPVEKPATVALHAYYVVCKITE